MLSMARWRLDRYVQHIYGFWLLSVVLITLQMMYLALTYDHRLLDGREAVTFLVKVKDLIEDPRRMLIT